MPAQGSCLLCCSPELEASVVTDAEGETLAAQWQEPLQQDPQLEAEVSIVAINPVNDRR